MLSSTRIPTICLLVTNLLVPIAILIFATGFFPYKTYIPGKASFEDGIHSAPSTSPPFDKVIFMVVDALRSDFVYSYESGFRFTQGLIRSGAAIPFTAHATSPTITMPRVKAITTGSIPSFLDVILNFAESDTSSSLANQDTWLKQLKERPGGKLVMYGDDTWLKLFPHTFSRADGTSSFFVSDFTEVDLNVTRHIPGELELNDWNGMILHFLGLDHIGHRSGPRSTHMVPKQAEMDRIVEQAYRAIEAQDHLRSTLLVLCGDHGMNEAGNHGGSAPGETSPALVFISPKLRAISNGSECPTTPGDSGFGYYNVVEQSDIAPTLAGLLGFPIPLNNLGVIIPSFLRFWNQDTRIKLLRQNAQQMLDIVKGTFSTQSFDVLDESRDCSLSTSHGDELHCLWSNAMHLNTISSHLHNERRLNALFAFCKRAQEIMSSTASNYNIRRLLAGICIILVAWIAAFIPIVATHRGENATWSWMSFVGIMYGVMMFASSYVEEEHHFWYWALSGWLFWLTLKQLRVAEEVGFLNPCLGALLLLTLRIARVWNQTGQKHAGEADIAKSVLPAHNILLWVLIAATYIDTLQRLSRNAVPWASRQLSTAATFALGIAAFGFKIAFTKADAPELLRGLNFPLLRTMEEASLVAQARAVFFSLLIFTVSTGVPAIYQRLSQRKRVQDISDPFHDLLTLFLITQSRTTNIPLFLLFRILFEILIAFELSETELSITSLCIQNASFFAFGGSNAISSIDLSNAYNGISGYNVGLVGVLTFCGNWAGPIWWTSGTVLLLTKNQNRESLRGWLQHLLIFSSFVSTSVLCVMVACTTLRTHLFIWTVFSPKYLYTMAWTFGQHLAANVGFASLLYVIALR